jgi:hypothetical protein
MGGDQSVARPLPAQGNTEKNADIYSCREWNLRTLTVEVFKGQKKLHGLHGAAIVISTSYMIFLKPYTILGLRLENIHIVLCEYFNKETYIMIKTISS